MIGSDELQTYYRLDVATSPVKECKDSESEPFDISYSLWDYFLIALSMINTFLFQEKEELRIVRRLRKAIMSKESQEKSNN